MTTTVAPDRAALDRLLPMAIAPVAYEFRVLFRVRP